MTQRDSHLKPFDFAAGEEAEARPPPRSGGRALLLLSGALLLAAAAAYFWYFDRDRAGRWLQDAPIVGGPGETTAYKWRDADGAWQITDAPPPAGVPYQTITVRSDVNILPSLKDSRQ